MPWKVASNWTWWKFYFESENSLRVIAPNVSNLAVTLNIFLEVGGEVQCSSHALETLTCFRPKFNLCRNNVAGFYLQNVWKTPVEEWSLYLKKANSTHWIFSMVLRIWHNLYIITTPWKVSVFRVFLVCIFPHSDTFLHTSYLAVFSSMLENTNKKKLRIWTSFQPVHVARTELGLYRISRPEMSYKKDVLEKMTF